MAPRKAAPKRCQSKLPEDTTYAPHKAEEDREKERLESQRLFEIKIGETLLMANKELGRALKCLKKTEKDGKNKGIFEAANEFAIKDITDNEEEEIILEGVSMWLKNTRNNVVSIEDAVREVEVAAGSGDCLRASAAMKKVESAVAAVKKDVRELDLAVRKIGQIFVISRTELLSF